MIPVKLELYNFLAYRSPEPLDLSGLHLACLAGANGAGKSSLLDALTWALWGKARSQRDDELIHGDELEMSVRLVFSLDGNLYRVARHRSRRGRGNTELHLEIQDGEGWRSISESTIRATQDKITRLLRLDYQTFINSAFLVQGRADEFTNKTPGERKAILGEILGLDAWSAYEERAKHRLREIDEHCSQIEARLESIDAELAREAEYQRELIQAQQDLDRLTGQVHEADIRYRELENARHERESRRTACEEVQRYTQQAENEMARIDAERQQYLDRLVNYEDVLNRREDIEAGYEALREARAAERDLSDRLLEQSELSGQRAVLQQEIATSRTLLEAEQRSLRQRNADLGSIIRESAGADALRDAGQQIAALENRQVERDRLQESLSQSREQRADLEGQNRALKAEMEAFAAQRDQISATVEPVCPLCGQELSDGHRSDLLETLEQKGSARGDEWRANHERVESLRAEESQLARSIQMADQELRKLPPLREHWAKLAERARRAEEAQQAAAALDDQLAEVERQLSGGDYAVEAQSALAQVEAGLAAVGYDEAAHQQARMAIADYESYEAQKLELDRALDGAPEAQSTIAYLDTQAEHWSAILAESREKSETLSAEIEALDSQLAELGHWEHELARLRDMEGQARYRVGAAKQRLDTLEQQRDIRQGLLAERSQLGEERTVYEELRVAFGKDGVPAMIIEAAIPEIEQEANQILTRMTDGRMHLRFDTQREKVTGGTKETLDIKIADELGTRDYATFSGGEAFRVNFAIRLALSQLLARRAGAQLRTLIIDEGFGTQDAQGRERLVHAINAIQDEFDLILVITHIDELKDAFPARIEITKTLDGSQIELI